MSETNRQEDPGVLALPERDRLYREWILPHLELSAEHEAFVKEHLNIPDTRGFFTHPGSIQISLDERAPTVHLKQLSCVVIQSDSMSLAGPREGALIMPVRDPKGRFVAFQLLANSQIEKIRTGSAPGPVRWWQATGAIRPLLPNGEPPILAERGADSDCVILAQGLAAATSIARGWDKHAISTTEDEFPSQALEEYLKEFHTKNILILLPRQVSRKRGIGAWNLAQQLHTAGWDVRMLVPVLGDGDMPKSFDECSALSLECWFENQPRSMRTAILGKSQAGPLNEKLTRLNEIRHITATAKIRAAYDDILAAGDTTSVTGLAKAAGVSRGVVKQWLDDYGIGDTAVLRNEMKLGWRPEHEPPRLPPAPMDVPDKVDDPEELPLFAFAEQEERNDSEESPPPHDDASTITTTAGPDSEHVPVPIDTPSGIAVKDDATVDAPADPESTAPPETDDGNDTLELVVEAKESVVEDESPLTQSIPMPDPEAGAHEPSADTQPPPDAAANPDDARPKAYVIMAVIIISLVAAILVLRFGCKKDVDREKIPTVPTEDLIRLQPEEKLPVRYMVPERPSQTHND